MEASAAAVAAPRAGPPPDYVQRPPTGPYRSLNPSTKAVIALAQALVAIGVRGWSGPLLVLAVILVSAAWARLGRAFVPFLLATIPLIVSILAVNTLLYPGATDRIVSIGPFTPTWTGLEAATQAALRVIAFAMSVALFVLTTHPDELVSDLERRGLGRRASFVIGATIRMVPRTLDRAREISDAQRARGLDTQGRWWRRIRGIVPLAGPLVFGALNEVEEQAMALEARGFSAPRRRTVLRAYPDSDAQRLLRWALVLVTVVALAASIAGLLDVLP